ncbi:MAG: hypothetical protein JSW25_00185 [Thermoplasmata archaeon]|nr:MAG: hypothetical protein JSW25_00185 [Thermoplasmata archaeon]
MVDDTGIVSAREVEGMSEEQIQAYVKKAKRVAMISTLIKIGIAISAIVALFQGEGVWVVTGLFVLAFTFVPGLLKKHYQITIPWLLELLIFLALFLHVIGGVFHLYGKFDNWDTMTHFVSTFMLAVVGLTIVYLMHVYWPGLKMDIRAIMVFTLFIAAFLGVFWEVLEWSADQIFGTNEQHGLDDTMKDLVMDMVGAMIAAMLGAKWIMDGTLRAMTADFGDAMNKQVFERLGSEMAETAADEAARKE